MRDADKSMYYIVSPQSFAYNPARINIGSIGYQNLAKNVIVSSLYEVFKTTDEVNDRFLWYWFKSDTFQKLIEQYQEGGVRLYFYYDKLCMCSISLPSVDEQRKIGAYLDHLDNLITLHQRKLDRLKQLKQGYLQQMFPRDGESVPRLRFANFHGKWEQRKLGELVDTVKSYPLSREAEVGEPTGYRYIHYGDIHKKVADLIESDKQLPIIQGGYYEFLQQGDIVVADASEDYVGIAEPSILLKQPTDKVVAGLHTIAMRPQEICSLFLYYLLHTVEFKQFGSRIGTGMKVFGITTKNLYKFPTFFPKKEEQVKIGNFFKQLDNTIVLHQSKLDRLKSLKKGYLQKMFI
ncbi:restriction endonuclease subunit S [Anaerocolumna aminovalerica]|uniref:restriction endonuclease subunit S n=1 Tax=Anaerocolumna aminovalerica TaxID=1527 RepID=UPI0031EF0488